MKMVNEQFNRLLEGNYNYRSVARLINKLTPGESSKEMAAKLALGNSLTLLSF